MAISDEDRKLAEETFGLIERSTGADSGAHLAPRQIAEGISLDAVHADTRSCPACSEPQHMASGTDNGKPWSSWMHDTALAAMRCPGLSDKARSALDEHAAAGSEVIWAGRTFGQLSPDEKRRAVRKAADQMGVELEANAQAISAILGDERGSQIIAGS